MSQQRDADRDQAAPAPGAQPRTGSDSGATQVEVPIDPHAKVPLPVGRLLLDLAVFALSVGLGIVFWHSGRTIAYALVLFLFAALALTDVVIVIRRVSRGEPTVIPDDGPTLLDDSAPAP
ncbi:hypothetical protein GB931_11140 [Modestobacter sp. I12A-02628]|uniref:Uncharacterized protein n=1 Tax=Goekera deserti TaxID=2497753 RepID=A0A7K3WDP5_9ACTN|nr:hypothetical protein [Goekera deserti]MPQ98461.1 hypothetical protein [Goekera deserti]NDI48290.1 hypothetical protein [Goekera deserti]NEL54039.1 hypothetical protein [Goekera deserti]